MSSEINSTLRIMALGRPFKVGMLYDYTTDKLIPNTSLWNSKLISNNSNYHNSPSNHCKVYTEDTLTMKADLLEMDPNLRMSALTGLVELSRSATLINDRKPTEQIQRYILKYSTTTYCHELTMNHLSKGNATHQELFNQKIATHVITSVLYGAEVYFIFDRKLFHGENHQKTDESVIKLLEKMITFQIFVHDELNLEENEKKIAELLTCQYYGDFDLDFNPKTFEEAAKLFRQLPKLLGEQKENTIPKQVWILSTLFIR